MSQFDNFNKELFNYPLAFGVTIQGCLIARMRVPASGSTVRVEAACADEVPPLLARPGDSWYRRPGDD